MESFYSKNLLEEFENMDMFKAGVTETALQLGRNWSSGVWTIPVLQQVQLTGSTPECEVQKSGTSQITQNSCHPRQFSDLESIIYYSPEQKATQKEANVLTYRH